MTVIQSSKLNQTMLLTASSNTYACGNYCSCDVKAPPCRIRILGR